MAPGPKWPGYLRTAFVYGRSAGRWREEARFVPFDGDFQEGGFGSDIAFQGERLAVGSAGFGAHLYRLWEGAWIEEDLQTVPGVGPGDRVAFFGDTLLATAPFDDPLGPASGSTFVFVPDGEAEPYCFGGVLACPCSNPDGDAGCANSTGNGAALDVAGGTFSLVADDLELGVRGLPASTWGLALVGAEATSRTFGDGRRCVRAGDHGVLRLPPQAADSSGALRVGPGLAASVGLTAFRTYRFQFWYRDGLGPCGTGFNLSNGIAVRLVL